MKELIVLSKEDYDALVGQVDALIEQVEEFECQVAGQARAYNEALADAHRENSLLDRERAVAERERDLLQDELADALNELVENPAPWPQERF